uniref:uncharacterized protein C8orf76 n=1 Tax=Doryrhamphus excisus TaxID=161450 RepID=UPI0025AE0243|nr:uncharacterized protein C8orf76 [Doryrhamphus excisus]
MEIFGSNFDDSVFSEAKDRGSMFISSYNAKRCEPEWFCESAVLDTEDSLEKQKVFKFRGDLALRKGNYQTALDAYSSCLEWIADNNTSIKRDILEGMARCCAKLGDRDRAMDLVDILSKEASNTCHLTSLLLLKVSIYQHLGAIGPRMTSLQELCSLVPYNPWNWFNLGKMCVELLEHNATSEMKEREAEDGVDLTESKLWLKACTSFIRTRLLLKILQQQQSSFARKRNENVLQSLEDALKRLNANKITLKILTEVMSEDLIPDKMKEDYQDGESLSSVCLQSFSERWWNKILLTGILEADGRGGVRSDTTL